MARIATRLLAHAALLTTLAVTGFAAPLAAATAPPVPKLIVAISIDQFSAALFDQYRSRFTGGLKTLQAGVVFANGYQSHAATETCPGHSTILTGRHPAATGIIANNWYDDATANGTYCIADPKVTVPGRDKPVGPARLKVPTLGEWMKAANPASRVYAVSGKDRAAITMAGHNPDGVFWWDDERGFTTYVPAGDTAEKRLAPVAAMNDAIFTGWKKAPPAWKPVDPRCRVGLGPHQYSTLTLDHELPPAGYALKPGDDVRGDPVLLAQFRASPGLDRIVLDLAEKLIATEKLGHGPAPDLLAVSFSATDYVGHRFGAGSPEMCDQLAHLDATLGEFVTRLTALKVPVLVVLTADHGGIDAAEGVAERGFAAQRFDAPAILRKVSGEVRGALKLDYDPLVGELTDIHIVPFGDDTPAIRAQLIAATVTALARHPEVVKVFTRAEALAGLPPKGKPADETTLLERVAESTDAARSGDLLTVLQPYATPGAARVGYIAGHGSPWNYDRRVPILFWWPGAEGFEQPLPIETVDIAPTLAAVAGVKVPEVDGRCLDLDRTAGTTCR